MKERISVSERDGSSVHLTDFHTARCSLRPSPSPADSTSLHISSPTPPQQALSVESFTDVCISAKQGWHIGSHGFVELLAAWVAVDPCDRVPQVDRLAWLARLTLREREDVVALAARWIKEDAKQELSPEDRRKKRRWQLHGVWSNAKNSMRLIRDAWTSRDPIIRVT